MCKVTPHCCAYLSKVTVTAVLILVFKDGNFYTISYSISRVYDQKDFMIQLILFWTPKISQRQCFVGFDHIYMCLFTLRIPEQLAAMYAGPSHTVANHNGEPVRMSIRTRSLADSPMSYWSVLERVSSQNKIATILRRSPGDMDQHRLLSVAGIRMESLSFAAVLIGSLRFVLHFVLLRDGIIRRWAKNT